MTLAVIAFTSRGADLAQEIQQKTREMGWSCQGYATASLAERRNLLPINDGLTNWTKDAFDQYQGIIFIGACGIAVRAIAPYLQGKDKDPAVVVIDEYGQYAISLLSGHLGGANDLAVQLAQLIEATPIVTTATDLNRKFAVDNWAKDQQLHIHQLSKVKHISSAILSEQKVGLCSSFTISGQLPEGIHSMEKGDLGICIDLDEEKQPFTNTLNLIPKQVVLGIGCRKGIAREGIEQLVVDTLKDHHISTTSIIKVCSIDLKAQEEGLLQFCDQWNLPFEVYSSELLAKVEGDFTPSSFVQSVTGVDNVCERSAILGSDNGTLLVKKQARDGVTVAVAIKSDYVLRF